MRRNLIREMKQLIQKVSSKSEGLKPGAAGWPNYAPMTVAPGVPAGPPKVLIFTSEEGAWEFLDQILKIGFDEFVGVEPAYDGESTYYSVPVLSAYEHERGHLQAVAMRCGGAIRRT